MYFKQLEIVGFKSFPNKTKLKFERGISAVVGPNGCGKSNVSDAIRWVLGEQSSKALRGSSMEDVIFNGTDSVEATGMAEVSLTLSNEDRSLPIDYDEVTITRRLFRSGESEYIVNKTPVRLKDITNILMGTGMGTSSYSIIEQGKIGMILSSKPEDRRFIFEEASGITRYKSQKREALRKLEHTENNLIRINDIINEVRRQINSVERHAKKAERYKTDFEEMKVLDLRLSARELRNMSANLEKNKTELETMRCEESTVKHELDEMVSSINTYRKDLDDTIHALTDAQKKLSETTLFIEKGRHKSGFNRERISDLRHLKNQSEEELAVLKEKINAQEEETGKIRQRLNDILKKTEEKTKEQAEKENSIKNLSEEIDAHQSDSKAAKNRTLDLLASQTKAKNELIKMGADLQNRKARSRRLETEKENLSEEKRGVDSSLEKASSELASSAQKVDERKKSLLEFKDKLASSESSLDKTRKNITEDEKTLNSLRSREEILKEMIENFEGFEKGVKHVMEAVKNGRLSGIIGVVADMITPEETVYEAAFEKALGKKAEALIAENKDAAESALRFLEDKASAHIIVYDDIKEVWQSRHKALMEKEGISQLSGLVKPLTSHETLADYLLGDTYLAESAGRARELIDKYGENIKFVTKEGAIIEKGYVFGGLIKQENTTSIIGRSRKLEELRIKNTRISGSLEELKAEKRREEENISALKRDIVSVEENLKAEEIEHANVLAKKEVVGGNLKKVVDELLIVELELGEVGELIHDITFKGGDLNKRLNENETECAGVETHISSSQEAVQAKTKTKNDFIIEISEIKAELGFLKTTVCEATRALEKETALFEELKLTSVSKEKAARASEEKINILLRETKDLEDEIEVKTLEEADLKEKLSDVTARKDKLSENLRTRETASREKETLLEELRNQIRTLEIKEREGELTAVNVTERIREAYKVDIRTLEIEIPEETNWEEVRNQIDVLKIKVDRLGPVNLVAIDEHKELEERFSFLTQQHQDLLSAKESLHKAIQTINKTTKQLFAESFQKIQIEFKSYFRMLFGGGHAELLLLDETDVLESGIEIIVRPPGKKLQNLLLLSGGEKALTAIALLFSIFKVKPSPFCILDEVDAPLDETNIGRFTRILKDFLKTSQFIVITHSKMTMQMADILYGITMEQKGVSKIVSVKFAEEEGNASPREKEVMV